MSRLSLIHHATGTDQDLRAGAHMQMTMIDVALRVDTVLVAIWATAIEALLGGVTMMTVAAMIDPRLAGDLLMIIRLQSVLVAMTMIVVVIIPPLIHTLMAMVDLTTDHLPETSLLGTVHMIVAMIALVIGKSLIRFECFLHPNAYHTID